MKFAIIGSGAVGGYYAGILKKSGEEIFLLSRGKALSNIRERGLKVRTDEGEFVVYPDVVSDNIADLGKVDCVILAVKAWQVREMASTLAPIISSDTILIPLQNGIEAYPELKELHGRNAVGGLTRIFCFVEEPGTIRQVGFKPQLIFGSDDSAATGKMKSIRESFLKAGISCEISKDIQKDLWEKFLIMATFGGVGSITQSPIGVMRSLKETREMLNRSMDEIISVAHSMNIGIGKEEKERCWEWIDTLPFETTSSTQRDVALDRPSEMGDLSGAVVRLGEIHGIDIPLHRFIYSSLLPRELKSRGELNY